MDDLRITGTGWGDFAEEPSQAVFAEESRKDNDARGTYREPRAVSPSKSRNTDTDSWQQPSKPGSHQPTPYPTETNTEAWEQPSRQRVELDETPRGFEPQPPPSGPRQMPWDKRAPAPAPAPAPAQTKAKAKKSRESQFKSKDIGIDISLFPSCVSLPSGDFRRDEPRHEDPKRRESKSSGSSHNEPNPNKPKLHSEQRDNGARPTEPPSRPMSGNVDSKKRINDLVRSIGMRKASPQEEVDNDFNRPLRIREIPEDGPGYVKTRSVERVPFRKAPQREDPADREYSRGRIEHASVRVDDWDNDDSDGETHHIGPLVDHHAEYYWKQTGEYLDDFSESKPATNRTVQNVQRHSEAINAVTAQMQDARFSNVQAEPWQPIEAVGNDTAGCGGNGAYEDVDQGKSTGYGNVAQGNSTGYGNVAHGNNSGYGNATHEESAPYENARKDSADYGYDATHYDLAPTNSATYYDPAPTNSATYYDAVSTCSATYENPARREDNPTRREENPTRREENPIQNDDSPAQRNDNPAQMNENPIETKENNPVLVSPPVRRRSLDTYSPCILSNAQELRAPSNYKPNTTVLDEGQSWVTCPFCHNGFGYPPLMLPTPPHSGLVANTAFTPKP